MLQRPAIEIAISGKQKSGKSRFALWLRKQLERYNCVSVKDASPNRSASGAVPNNTDIVIVVK